MGPAQPEQALPAAPAPSSRVCWWIALAAPGFVFLMGALALLGWALGLQALKSVFPNSPVMVPNTATTLVLAALSLWLLRSQAASARIAWGRVFGGIVLFLGALTLVEFFSRSSLGIDTFLFRKSLAAVQTPIPGRPSFLTALNFVLIGLSLLFLDFQGRYLFRASEVLTAASMVISFLALIGHVCSVPSFYGWTSVFRGTGMAFHTMLAFLALGGGLLCARPDRGLIQTLSSKTSAGLVARRLILAPVLIPMLTGLVQMAARRVGVYNPEFASWLFAFLNILIFTFIIWGIARLLYRAELVRSRAEADILKLNAELGIANKDLDAFASSVAHDLHAPARHMAGYAEMFSEKFCPALDEDAKRYLRNISESARRMTSLISDLLAFSRQSRAGLRPRSVNLNALVAEVRKHLAEDIKDREIIWTVSDLPVLNADEPMLRQVFINLLSNAVKYTRGRKPAEIEIGGGHTKTGEFIIHVGDNGVGFDMQYADRLFEVFQRLHSLKEFEGNGIGLANVRRIIARHGGRAWAEGEIGKGAKFYFSLPDSGMEN